MNASPPIDDQNARATALTAPARLVDGEVPTLVVDARECTILAANASAEQGLGLIGQMPIKIDRAMPAWAVIRDFHDCTAVAAVGSRTTALVFWTPTGPLALNCTLEAIDPGAGSTVRIRFAAPLIAGSAAEIKAASAQPIATPETPAGDLATLREIARRIRAGTGAITPSAPSLAEVQSDTTRILPPPLDFQPVAAAKETSTIARSMPETSPGTNPSPGANVAKLAHELRTPLSAIVSLAEIMRDERLGAMGNPRYKAYAADIHDSARHTLDLIGAMLDGDHEPAGVQETVSQPRVDLVPVDLNEIANRCVSAMQPIGARGGVDLEVAAGPDLPRLLADRRALRQIILNLLSNALRFTPQGGLITLTTASRDDGTIEFAVSDTGTGMRANEIDRALGKALAEPLRLRLAGQQSGFGFGLPLVRELAQAHGGRLTIDSVPGKGTRITVIFPASNVVTS